MDSSILKYDLLNSFEKKEVKDFIDFLFNKKKKESKNESSHYKNKILSVSTWSEDDIKSFNENKKLFNRWPPTTW
jgi:hypothetical protein